MNKKKIIVNVFSSWTFFVVTVMLAFIVSPIMVRELGDEAYGVWVLIVSLGSYFTVLDFGINTAIVRYMSKYNALNDVKKSVQIYSSSFALFLSLGLIGLVVISTIGLFFKDFFTIESFSEQYIFMVVCIVGLDLALNLVFSVLSGTMKGLQNFLEINIIMVTVVLVKNSVLIYLLLNGYSLLSLAILLIAATLLKYTAQYVFIKKKYTFLHFKVSGVNKSTIKLLLDYSVYSFIIAVALKILFSTDAIVIGSLLSVEKVTLYSIPAMILENLEKFVWAIIAVLIPVISAKEATGKGRDNSKLYIIGTKYTFLMCSPIILVLFLIGDDFIGIWMGPAYAEPSGTVLNILLFGYIFSVAQLIAQGILKGISKHKVLAIIFSIQAVSNLILSVILAPIYGINGVALGTVIPLLVSSIFLVPYFTCKELNLNYMKYMFDGIVKPGVPLVALYMLLHYFNIEVVNFTEVIGFSVLMLILVAVYTFSFQLEREHKEMVMIKIKAKFNV